jgi:hypothetical protein
MRFEGFGDLRVQLLPGTAQQAAMRRVLHQRVLETVHRIGRRAALKDQLRGYEPLKSRLQLVLRVAGDGMQQRVRELASDCGTDLRQSPDRLQAVEPRHQRVM